MSLTKMRFAFFLLLFIYRLKQFRSQCRSIHTLLKSNQQVEGAINHRI